MSCYDILGMAKLERYLFVELLAMHCDQLFNDSLSCFPFAFWNRWGGRVFGCEVRSEFLFGDGRIRGCGHFGGERNHRCLEFTNVTYIASVGDIYSPVDGTRCIAVFSWEDACSSKRSDILCSSN